MPQPLICLKDLSFQYPNGRQVLRKVNLDLFQGDRIGLLGPNGSGKTTLFHLIMGLLQPASGQIEIFGQSVRSRKDFTQIRRRIGLLFQDPDDQLFSPTVLEDVAFGPLNLGKSPQEAIDIARATLRRLDLEGFEGRVTHRLSGGEKRLVSLATVLSMEPEVLLLDEPTTGLDSRTKETLKTVLGQLKQALILISHEMDFLLETTESVYYMHEGMLETELEAHLHQHLHVHPLGRLPHGHD